MTRILSILSLILIFNLSSLAKKKTDNESIELNNWLQTEAASVLLPAFHNSLDIESRSFQLKDLLSENYINLEKLRPEENDILEWNQQSLKWEELVFSDMIDRNTGTGRSTMWTIHVYL